MGYLQKVRLDDSESIIKEYTAGSGISISNQGVISTTGGSTITVDDALSSTSENPVQNKVITSNINSLNSQVTNIDNRVTNIENGGNIDNALSTTSTNAVQNKVITEAINNIKTQIGSGQVWAIGKVFPTAGSTVNFNFAEIPNSSTTAVRQKILAFVTMEIRQTTMNDVGAYVVFPQTGSVKTITCGTSGNYTPKSFSVAIYLLP